MPTKIEIGYEGYKRVKNIAIRTEVSYQINPLEKYWYFVYGSFPQI